MYTVLPVEFASIKQAGFLSAIREEERRHVKQRILILTVLLATILPGIALGRTGGSMKNAGQIYNAGKIETSVAESSQGRITNPGSLFISAAASFQQDTIDGHVIYDGDDQSQSQFVPQIVYQNLEFSGRGLKRLEALDTIVTLDTFVTASGEVQIVMREGAEVVTRGRVKHNGIINRDFLHGRVVMQGTQAQAIDGNGSFKVLALDNAAGSDVVNGGGFSVNHRLELLRGMFRNDVANNFTLGDSALIVRSVASELAEAPLFGENVSVTYIGDGKMFSGAELPVDDNTLQNLRLETTEGLVLNQSVTVNDTLYLGSNVDTDPGQEQHVLTHASIENPEFGNDDVEVRGSVRRTRLAAGGVRNVFNNKHTYAAFEDEQSLGGMTAMTVRVLPDTIPLPLTVDTEDKVLRSITVTAEDEGGEVVQDGFNAEFGYAFRLDQTEELNGLDTFDVQLQYSTVDAWQNVAEPRETIEIDGNWARGSVPNLQRSGFYAIGIGELLPNALVDIRILMEGPYRNGRMAADLSEGGFLPNSPPAMYPYSLDPNRQFIAMGELGERRKEIVDWVVVEFRTLLSGGESRFRTGLITWDGNIVDYRDGQTQIKIDSGTYYIVVHHRNHLAVVTRDQQMLTPEIHSFDFTRAALLLGGSNAVNLVDESETGRQYYAMIGGDTNGDGVIDDRDYDSSATATWLNHDAEGYVNPDTDMNGIVTTRDANVSWNNREKESFAR